MKRDFIEIDIDMKHKHIPYLVSCQIYLDDFNRIKLFYVYH